MADRAGDLAAPGPEGGDWSAEVAPLLALGGEGAWRARVQRGAEGSR